MGTRKPYLEKFRLETVKLVTEQGLARSQVARDLGVDAQTLRRWRAAAPITPAPAETFAAMSDLAWLRRENEQLPKECDIVQKAVSSLSRMPNKPALSVCTAHAQAYPVSVLCRVLPLARSSYYAWKRRSIAPTPSVISR